MIYFIAQNVFLLHTFGNQKFFIYICELFVNLTKKVLPMKTICFYFQVHQPFRLKRYRFFDIGSDHYYYDDFSNEDIIRGIANRSYLPANAMLLDLIREYQGKFKVALSISGVALEQLEIYVPEAIDGFKELAKTGCVEFLAETYAHSLRWKIRRNFRIRSKSIPQKYSFYLDKRPKFFAIPN